MKVCTQCGEEKPLDEFYADSRRRDGHQGSCKACDKRSANEWYHAPENRERIVRRRKQDHLKNRERDLESSRQWYQNNRDRARDAYYRRHYGISAVEYDEMFARQRGLCAACGRPETRVDNKTGKIKRLATDHDHETGKVTGLLLCQDCNTAEGLLGSNPDRIIALYNYVRMYRNGTNNRIAA